MRTQRVAKVILVDPERKAWLARRNINDGHRPGEWDLFGGGERKRRPWWPFRESFGRIASRELFEESGVVVRPRDLEPVYTETSVRTFESGETREVEARYFAARTDATSDDMRLTEHSTVQLFPLPDAIEATAEYPRLQRILTYLHEHNILEVIW